MRVLDMGNRSSDFCWHDPSFTKKINEVEMGWRLALS
jgi:hypothetical protein